MHSLLRAAGGAAAQREAFHFIISFLFENHEQGSGSRVVRVGGASGAAAIGDALAVTENRC